MRSAIPGILACFLVLVPACGNSHTTGSRNDSETHFLTRCDSSCAEGLACICGVCTQLCAEDADCAELSGELACQAPAESDEEACGAAPPAAVCDASCRDDADCRSVGAGHRCESGVCRAEAEQAPPPEPMCGVDEEEMRGPTRRVEVTTVLTNTTVRHVVGYTGGAAFVDMQGRVLTLGFEDTEPTVIWERPGGADDADDKEITALASDGQTLYWAAATPPVPSGLPDPQWPEPPSTIERIDIDGSNHAVLVDSDDAVFYTMTVDDEYLYFVDATEMGLLRIARDGGEIEMHIPELRGRPARAGDYFYWMSGEGLERGHVESGAVETVLDHDEPMVDTVQDVQAAGAQVVLVVADPKAGEGTPDQAIALLDAGAGCMRVLDLPDNGITWPLRPLGNHVFWKGFTHGGISPGDPDPGARFWRTDLTTGESVQLEPNELAVTLTVDVLGQDAQNLFVTSGTDLIRVAK